MYIVCGGNIFEQWLTQLHTINGFRKITFTSKRNNIKSSAKLKCISWSYNIVEDNADFYIIGAFKESDNIVTKINLPVKYKNNDNDLKLIGNDEYLILFDNNNIFWKLYLNDIVQWNWKRIPNFIESPESNDMKRIKTTHSVIKAVTKNYTCVCLLSTGAVYEIPTKIDTDHCDGVICDIACGFDHTIALTSNGVVYTWGDGGRCQLGNGDLKNSEEPQSVDALLGIKIIKVAAGGWHNLALSDCAVLYTWGWNESGQLGVTEKDSANATSHAIPIVVDFYDENGRIVDINIKDIACGSRHSAILDSNNTIWTTGINNYGQLGFDSERTTLLKRYRKVLSTKKDCSIFCGPWVTVVTF